ncbi:hypothetical protein KEJ17_05895 [Candidatus Bathyarchaeota archaeon]|nr:hypothetical protein [Candidatus Bathyarchaeota archaeon]
MDIKKILSSIENKYHIKLPRKVIALDYGKRGGLYIRFKYIEKPIGEPTEDGFVIFFYDDGKDIVALEIVDVEKIV